MDLYKAIERRDVNLIEQLLKDHDFLPNNIFAGFTPLTMCCNKADDNKVDDCKIIIQIMRLILHHPKCNVNATNGYGRPALHWVCAKLKSVEAARLLLSQDGIDIGVYDRFGSTALHVIMENIRTSNVSTATLIFDEFLKLRKKNEIARIYDKFGLNILDRFLCNTRVHSHDLDISRAIKHFLKLVLSIKGMVNASGKTLALAGTLCSPSVFQILVDAGADPNDSLGDETTAHCVIARNSLAKCTLLSTMKPNLSVKWMGNTAVELARIYGCSREIIDIFATSRPTPSDKNQFKTSDDSKHDSDGFLHDWTKFQPLLPSKIHIGHNYESKTSPDINALNAIKYNQYYMKLSRRETEYMKTELVTFFNVISDRFNASSHSSHFAYTYHLRGSMHDNCKCYGPNEFDAVLKIMDLNELNFDGLHIEGSGRWRAYCNDDGYLIICAVAQAFYQRFALQCHEQNDNLKDRSCGFTHVAFQCLTKISRLKLIWNGETFKNLIVYVDIVLAFPFHVKSDFYPFCIQSRCYYPIAKAERHAHDNATLFPESLCEIEAQIMKSLPEPIRQGFITAKAVRLSTVCAPGFDAEQFKLTEDLAIEDYITSHALKNCLLNILKTYRQGKPHRTCKALKSVDDDDDVAALSSKICKYVIADNVYERFQDDLEAKKMQVWDDKDKDLFNCTYWYCYGEEYICCKKRIIRLDLVKTIRVWLNNKENLRYMHDSDDCTCEYTCEELKYHQDFMSRLIRSKMIQIDQIHDDQNGEPDSQSLNQSIDLAFPNEQYTEDRNECTKCPCSCSCSCIIS